MTQPFVRPDVQAMLAALKENPRPPMSDALIAQIRQIPPDTMPSPDLPVGDLATVRDVEMPRSGQDPHGAMRLRMYDPREHREPGPVMVFYHGGGFVVGGIETHAGLAAELARGLDLPVVSVDYRLAPEHKWPAAPDDAEAAARWIVANGAAFDRQFTGLVLCGDSAGGTLTAVTALALRDAPAEVPLLLQWPIYPVIDVSKLYPSGSLFGTEYGLGPDDMAYFGEAYAADPTHPRHSALLAEQAGMPPTFVVTAGLDPLRDQGRAYAAKLIEAGVDVSYREYAGTVHGFATFRLALPSAREDLADMIAIARQMLDHALRQTPA